jgi:hypothetical protein
LLDTWLEYITPGGPPEGGNLGLYGTRPVGAGYESDPQILTLQANLETAGETTSDSPVFPLDPPSFLAAYYNPHLSGLLDSTWTRYSVNVVQVDYAELCLQHPTPSTCIRTIVNDITRFNDQTFGRVPFGMWGASQIAVGHDGSVNKLGFTPGPGSGALGFDYPLAKLTGNTGHWTDWTDYPIAGNRIAADPSGGVWVLDATGTHLREFNTQTGTISKTLSIPSFASLLEDIAVNNTGTLYAVAKGQTPFFGAFSAPIAYSNGQWLFLAGAPQNAARIAANNSVIAVLDTNGNIFESSGNGTWTPLNQPFTATSIAVDDAGYVWATQAEKAVGAYPGYTPIPTSGLWQAQNGVWTQMRTDGVRVAAGFEAPGVDVVYVADKAGNIHSLGYGVPTSPQ